MRTKLQYTHMTRMISQLNEFDKGQTYKNKTFNRLFNKKKFTQLRVHHRVHLLLGSIDGLKL